MPPRVKKQWIVDAEPHLRHAKMKCARGRAEELDSAVTELSGLSLEEHRLKFGEKPAARCPRKGCWGERQRAMIP